MTKRQPELKIIPVEFLQRGRYQPRRQFNPEILNELAESIKSQGIIQPIVVRQLNEVNRYEIIAGERRWRAAQLIQLAEVPCIVRQETDSAVAEMALIENIQRDDLNPIEEAAGYQRLIDDFGYLHDEIGSIVGKSREKITNCLRLLKLHPTIKDLLIERSLSEGHGKLLASLEANEQLHLGEQAIKYGWSVRKLEDAIKNFKKPIVKRSGNEPNIQALEKLISEQLGTSVQIEPDGGYLSGELKIKFFSNDTLAGILDKLGVKYNE